MIAPTNVIDGKPVKAYVDLPFGTFQKLARAKIDPLWGSHGGELVWKVEVSIQKTRREVERETRTIFVAADDERSARKMADEQLVIDDEDEWGDIDCDFDIEQVEYPSAGRL